VVFPDPVVDGTHRDRHPIMSFKTVIRSSNMARRDWLPPKTPSMTYKALLFSKIRKVRLVPVCGGELGDEPNSPPL